MKKTTSDPRISDSAPSECFVTFHPKPSATFGGAEAPVSSPFVSLTGGDYPCVPAPRCLLLSD